MKKQCDSGNPSEGEYSIMKCLQFKGCLLLAWWEVLWYTGRHNDGGAKSCAPRSACCRKRDIALDQLFETSTYPQLSTSSAKTTRTPTRSHLLTVPFHGDQAFKSRSLWWYSCSNHHISSLALKGLSYHNARLHSIQLQKFL